MWERFKNFLDNMGIDWSFILFPVGIIIGIINTNINSEKSYNNSSLAVDTPAVSYPNPELDKYYTEEARKQAINDTLEKLQEKMEYVNKEKEIERLRLQLNK